MQPKEDKRVVKGRGNYFYAKRAICGVCVCVCVCSMAPNDLSSWRERRCGIRKIVGAHKPKLGKVHYAPLSERSQLLGSEEDEFCAFDLSPTFFVRSSTPRVHVAFRNNHKQCTGLLGGSEKHVER